MNRYPHNFYKDARLMKVVVKNAMSATHDTRGILRHMITATDNYPVKLIVWYFITKLRYN